ncbi:MAG: heme exporter protein CcmD [Bacteroidales bacterium]|nr:heme exporter protein CcmD [Bacteroidales bacterium]
MSFQFDSLAAFYAMGGHGPFVWLSYLFTLVVLVWLVVSPLMRTRRLRSALARRRPAMGAQRSAAEERES